MGRTVTAAATFFPHLTHYLRVTLISENKISIDYNKHLCPRLGGVPLLAHFILTTTPLLSTFYWRGNRIRGAELFKVTCIFCLCPYLQSILLLQALTSISICQLAVLPKLLLASQMQHVQMNLSESVKNLDTLWFLSFSFWQLFKSLKIIFILKYFSDNKK